MTRPRNSGRGEAHELQPFCIRKLAKRCVPETYRCAPRTSYGEGRRPGIDAPSAGNRRLPGRPSWRSSSLMTPKGAGRGITSTLSVSRFSIASSSACPGGPITSAFSARLSPWTTKFREAAKTHSHDHGWQRGSSRVQIPWRWTRRLPRFRIVRRSPGTLGDVCVRQCVEGPRIRSRVGRSGPCRRRGSSRCAACAVRTDESSRLHTDRANHREP